MSAIGRHVSRFPGYAPALPTPFNDKGNIDAAAFDRLCELQIENGASALVVCADLEPEGASRAHSDSCFAFAWSDSCYCWSRWERNGACDRIDQGCRSCRGRRDLVGCALLQLILYDVPSRTGCGLTDETVARLAELPGVMGIKDAAGDATRPARLRPLIGTDFRLLCGDDALALAYTAQGGDGCISVTSNIAPSLCRNMFLAWRHNHSVRAQRLARPIAQLTAALFREGNLVGVKYALSLFGLMSPSVRLPLVESSSQSQAELAHALTRICDEYSEYMIGSLAVSIDVAPRAVVAG
jgi:4-hydroxy-tetrahydrodipicolinate synthase